MKYTKLLIVHCSLLIALSGCSKPDPILPGTRTPIFNSNNPTVQNTEITNADKLKIVQYDTTDCKCRVDLANIIWCNDRKVFSGFATNAHVKSERAPVCDGAFVYAGLSTGELVRVNRNSREISWIADVYKPSNMLGGATVLDIVAPVTVTTSDIYAGGLGDAFCKINKSTGAKKWCVYVGVATDYIVTDRVVFIVGTDNNLYAINNSNGNVYWTATGTRQTKPVLQDETILVGKEQFNIKDGKKL